MFRSADLFTVERGKTSRDASRDGKTVDEETK